MGLATENRVAGRVAGLQAAYYVATGVWPLLHYDSFEWATGRKRERWLVETVGGLTLSVGAAAALAKRQGRITPEILLVLAGTAATLAAVDVIYLGRRRLRWVYGLDACAQGAFLVGLTWGGACRRPTAQR
jgi:hypothetical protein